MKTKLNENGYLVFNDGEARLVHRWVAEKKYGKDKIQGKEIHHIDNDKKNNEKSNLLLLEKEDHYYLTKHENKVKLLLDLIIYLTLFYIITINLLNYTSFLNKEVSLAFVRVSVYVVLFVALELKYGFIEKMIRRPKAKQF